MSTHKHKGLLTAIPGSQVTSDQRQGIADKVRTLIYERDLGVFAKSILDPERFLFWAAAVSDTQREIYELDLFYEANNSTGSPAEKVLWENLDNCVTRLPSDLHEVFEEYVCILHNYALDEAEIRAFEYIDLTTLSALARRKCTDVSLNRRLALSLAERSHLLPSLGRFFEYFDACMEILEDFHDIQEDTHNWNLNLWLTPIRQGLGIDATMFSNFTACNRLLRDLEDAWQHMTPLERDIASPYKDRVLRKYRAFLRNRLWVYLKLSSTRWIPYAGI